MPSQKTQKPSAPGSVYAVYGTEEFLKRQAVAALTDRILGNADRGLALSEYDGRSVELTLADVLDDVRTLPFLTDRRLVVVREADSFITRYRAQLEDYVANPSPTGVLLLECKKLPANTRLHKAIKAVGELHLCGEIKAYQVPAWAVTRARDGYGKRLDQRAAALLVDQIGRELGLLDAELAKLSLYVGGRDTITAADIEALSGHYREEKVWGILSAIAAGNRAEALTLWEDVWQTDRAAPARAVAGLAFTVRRLLDAKKAHEAKAPWEEVKRLAGAFKDQPLKNELAAFASSQLEQMLCRLLEADEANKIGQASVQTSIEAFIIEACAQRAGRRHTG